MAVFSLSQSDVRVDARNSTETNSPSILQREEDLAYPLKLHGNFNILVGRKKMLLLHLYVCRD